jgi:hypothetical protein
MLGKYAPRYRGGVITHGLFDALGRELAFAEDSRINMIRHDFGTFLQIALPLITSVKMFGQCHCFISQRIDTLS